MHDDQGIGLRKAGVPRPWRRPDAFVQLVFWLDGRRPQTLTTTDAAIAERIRRDPEILRKLEQKRRRQLMRALGLRGRPPEPFKDLFAWIEREWGGLRPVEIAQRPGKPDEPDVSRWVPTRVDLNQRGDVRLRSTLAEAHVRRGGSLRGHLRWSDPLYQDALRFIRELEESGRLLPARMSVEEVARRVPQWRKLLTHC